MDNYIFCKFGLTSVFFKFVERYQVTLFREYILYLFVKWRMQKKKLKPSRCSQAIFKYINKLLVQLLGYFVLKLIIISCEFSIKLVEVQLSITRKYIE